MNKLGVIILAGGLSSRMGRHKALLPWVNGESLISHALRNVLEQDIEDIIISVGEDAALGAAIQRDIIDTLSNNEKNKVSIVRDTVERCGPLGGLYSALSVGTASAYAVLAVDMPLMDISLYYRWLYSVDEDWNAIVPYTAVQGQTKRAIQTEAQSVSDGEKRRNEPLAGIYKPIVASHLQAVMARGDVSLQQALTHIGPVVCVDASGQEQALRNVNRYDEYLWARAEAENMSRLIPLISVVGAEKHTGKTTVITKLVNILSEAGLSVGVVKSDAHGFQIDYEGTDTDRFITSGATAVAIAGPEETVIRIRTEGQSDLWQLSQRMPTDLVILETRSQGIFPIIEAVTTERADSYISEEEERVATVNIADADADDKIERLAMHIQAMVRGVYERRYR